MTHMVANNTIHGLKSNARRFLRPFTALAVLLVGMLALAGAASAQSSMKADWATRVVQESTADVGYTADLAPPEVYAPEAAANLDYYANLKLDENVKGAQKAAQHSQVSVTAQFNAAIDAASAAVGEIINAAHGAVTMIVDVVAGSEKQVRGGAQAQADAALATSMDAKAETEAALDGILADATNAAGSASAGLDGKLDGLKKGVAETKVDYDLTAKFSAFLLGLFSLG